MTPSVAPFSDGALEEAIEIASSAGLRATVELTGVGAVLVRRKETCAVMTATPRCSGTRSVWHGCAPIGQFDAPSAAELAIGDVLEATDGFAAFATVLAPAVDGRKGTGPIDALILEPARDVKIGCRWICGIDTVRTQQTRLSLVSLTFTSRQTSEELHKRLAVAPRLKRLPDWANVSDTAALLEVMGDPLWPDDLSKASTILALRQMDQHSGGGLSWRVWLAAPPGARVLGLADMIGRVAEPELPPAQVRRMINDASALRRKTPVTV